MKQTCFLVRLMNKCSLFVSSHVSSSGFLWLNKHLLKKDILETPGSAAGPKCVGSVQCKAGPAGFSIHMLSAVFSYPGGDYVEGKKPSLAGMTRHDLACQLPHKPVLPPLGSSTPV